MYMKQNKIIDCKSLHPLSPFGSSDRPLSLRWSEAALQIFSTFFRTKLLRFWDVDLSEQQISDLPQMADCIETYFGFSTELTLLSSTSKIHP